MLATLVHGVLEACDYRVYAACERESAGRIRGCEGGRRMLHALHACVEREVE
jgi:hypothetical protein